MTVDPKAEALALAVKQMFESSGGILLPIRAQITPGNTITRALRAEDVKRVLDLMEQCGVKYQG